MKSIAIVPVLALFLVLAGCAGDTFVDEEYSPYFRRSDFVTTGAGNAVAADAAIQTIDPWPRNVYNTHVQGDGAIGVKAFNKYEAGPSDSGASTGSSSSSSGSSPSSGASATTTSQ
jgi:hypothetical protein